MKKWIKRVVIGLILLGGVLAAAYLFRGPLLRGVASAWIVNEPLAKADVIVVLGGGPETRPGEAARLLRQGLAPKILLMNPKPTAAAQMGLVPTEANIDRMMLAKQKVPEAEVVVASEFVNSTYQESLAVSHWARTNQVHSVIVVTDIFHARRAEWVFRKTLNPLGVKVAVDATPVREYTAKNWWQHEEGLVAFQSEILKYAFYRVKY